MKKLKSEAPNQNQKARRASGVDIGSNWAGWAETGGLDTVWRVARGCSSKNGVGLWPRRLVWALSAQIISKATTGALRKIPDTGLVL